METTRVDKEAVDWAACTIAELVGHVNPSNSEHSQIHREAVIRFKDSDEVVDNLVTRSITRDSITCLRLGEAVATNKPVTIDIIDDEVQFSFPGRIADCREAAAGLFLLTIALQ